MDRFAKTENPAQHRFKHFAAYNDKLLLCPKCFEIIFRDDIEHFATCPYCDHHLEMDSELENYLLKPMIDQWLTRQHPYSHEIPFNFTGQSGME